MGGVVRALGVLVRAIGKNVGFTMSCRYVPSRESS